MTFLFSVPDSLMGEGFFFYPFFFLALVFLFFLFCNLRRWVSQHIHSSLQATHSPKASVNALIKNRIISQRIERENVFLVGLFVCLFPLSSVFPCARLRNHLHGT